MTVNSSISTGSNNVHPRFIKESASELALLPVCILCNNSLSEGDLHKIWMMANASCIFKMVIELGCLTISLTSLFCRLLEKSE